MFKRSNSSKIEDLQCLLYITTQIKFHKKKQINHIQLKFKADNNEKFEISDI